jgi:formylglycine-generating enzyme required for sulfatase activity
MCGTGQNASNNCESKVCTGSICQAPSCNDGVQNGNETDIDCGGGTCPACNPGQKCDQASDCVGMVCETTCQCPTGMVVAPIQGSGIYCIDATEVSYGQYQLFYDANPPTDTQSAVCTWNTAGWTPAANWPALPANVDNPVTNVNWCQAAGYCKYEGRRLCGQIGGGSVALTSFTDFTKDQWYNACTAQGTNVYPYGSTYDSLACNGSAYGAGFPVSWQTLLDCIGGETGLLEMSGNVAEWEDSCSGANGAGDSCAVRGGSFTDGPSGLRCDSGGAVVTQARNAQANNIGFRCCL